MSPHSLPIAVFSALFLHAAAVNAVQPVKNKPYRDSKTGLEFSDLAGFTRLPVHHFKDPRLGFAVDYNSASENRITVYVYTFGHAKIPDGPFSPTVRSQLDAAKSDIVRALKMGRYQAADELLNEVIVLGERDSAPKMRKSRFRIRRNNREWVSYIFLTGHNGHYVKVRCTYPAEKQAACEKELARLLKRMGAMLSGDRKLSKKS